MLQITLEDPRSPIAAQMITALTDEIKTLYPGDEDGLFSPGDVLVPGSAFIIAWQEGTPVGCGALCPTDEPGLGEIKRMYVSPEVRGQRIGRRILEKIEELAGKFGYDMLRLEAGSLQPEAIRLYERCGYVRIPCYELYAENPLSVCFQKKLLWL